MATWASDMAPSEGNIKPEDAGLFLLSEGSPDPWLFFCSDQETHREAKIHKHSCLRKIPKDPVHTAVQETRCNRDEMLEKIIKTNPVSKNRINNHFLGLRLSERVVV